MTPFRICIPAFLSLMLVGCAEDDFLGHNDGVDDGRKIDLICSIQQEYDSRANDGGFTDGDAIGVFLVDYNGAQPGKLSASGNHATNVKFVYDENTTSWTGAAQLYWTDGATAVDAYGYYPFMEPIADVEACPFEIATRQDQEVKTSGMSGYEASDFLWAKAEGVQPGRTINLLHHHIMSSVQVILKEGDGFEGTWEGLDKSVTIENTLVRSAINLSTGVVTPDKTGKAKSVTPYKSGDNYRAIVLPQTVPAAQTLVAITIDGDGYQFKRNSATAFLPGKLYKFTLRVDKKLSGDFAFTLVSESITDWENDEVGHNASSKVYTVVNCPAPGQLEAAVNEAGLIPSRIENLKLTGTMNNDDFHYFRENFGALVALNMRELRTVGIPIIDWGQELPLGWGIYDDCRQLTYEDVFDDALPHGMLGPNFSRLQNIVLPDSCKYVGNMALASIPIVGTLTFPEGVKWIGFGCVGCYGSELHHISTLNLPSTLEYIGGEAFNGCDFTNELILPDNLKYIGDHAFRDCKNSYGMAHLPENIAYLGNACFLNIPLVGTAVYPAGTKVITSAFAGTQVSSVYIPEGAEEISAEAFWGTPLKGDLYLPSSIKKIGERAFPATMLSHVRIPPSVEVIEENAFSWNSYLMDTIVIPEGVRRIDHRAFCECPNVSVIKLPSTLEIIESEAFVGCYSVRELQCDAVIPPTLIGDPFSGSFAQLHKDNFTLVVPGQSIGAYQDAEYWREFKRISEYHNLVFRPQKAKVLNKGGVREVILNADAQKTWTVTHCPSWLHISATSGTGKSKLTITIDEMAHGSANREDEIKVKLQGTDYETSFKVQQFDYEYDEDQSYTIQAHTVGAGVDLVIIGDGYDAEDIHNNTYLSDMQKAAEMFFDLEPFKTYRDYFNVYTAFAMSNESGIGSVNYLRDSKFKTSYGDGTYDSRVACAADAAAIYSLDNTPVQEANFGKMTCILVANGESYDGVTTMFDNGTAVAICPKSTSPYPYDWRGLIQHEGAGHGFTKLADEYIYHRAYIAKCRCNCCDHLKGLAKMQSKGWGLNVTANAKTNDVPWKHLLYDNRTNDIVDIWEGGYFHLGGVFRSEYNSVMNHNEPYMSTWSRELAVRRIMDYAGVPYSYEDFLAKDSREWGRDFTIGSRASQSSFVAPAPLEGAAPIIVEGAPQRDFKGVRKHKHNH